MSALAGQSFKGKIMFRNKSKSDSEIMLEAAEVQIFLRNSVEFKKMKEIAAKSDMSKYRDFLDRLEKCTSVGEMLYQCSPSYDIKNHDDVVIQNMGRNRINAICFVWGIFSDAASYQYYGIHFYESVVSYLEEKKRIGNLAHNYNK